MIFRFDWLWNAWKLMSKVVSNKSNERLFDVFFNLKLDKNANNVWILL